MKTTLPSRPFPRSGDMLSVVGFGAIIVKDLEAAEASRWVGTAVERGVTYFDVAPAYGSAEEILGPALEPWRDRVFLACKTACRDGKGAREDLERSLERMRTSYFDLYQLHAITDPEKDVRAVFAKGGAMEVIDEAKRAGVLRHVGFSAHSVEAAFLAMDLYDFDSVLFPINYTTYTRCHFGPQLLERARERNMARLALKAMARGKWREEDPNRPSHPNLWYEPEENERAQELALRFTLNTPITAALPPGEGKFLLRALDIIEKNPDPLSPAEEEELARLTEGVEPIFDPVAT